MSYQLLCGDATEELRTLPSDSVHCCVTSPPYFGLRAYLPIDHPDRVMEIGLEYTPDQYVARLVEVFREVRRVLHPTGVVFLNLGDSYAASGQKQTGRNDGGRPEKQGGFRNGKWAENEGWAEYDITRSKSGRTPGLKPKDLIGIPWMTAFALRADGWWLRSAITWCKGNPMPESVLDRPTSATEMVFMLAKSERYFYDAEAIAEPASQPLGAPKRTGQHKATVLGEYRGMYADTPSSGLGTNQGASTRNRRNWWLVNSEPYPGSHYAVMPSKLVEPCVLAGSSAYGVCAKCLAPYERVVERTNESTWQERKANGAGSGSLRNGHNASHGKGVSHDLPAREGITLGWTPTCRCGADVVPAVVLDPFAGSGTVLAVALKHGRRAIGIDLDPRNQRLVEDRIRTTQPLLISL